MAVTQLGYIGLNVSDLRAWQSLAGEVMGFQARPREKGAPLYLRIDERHHRFALYEAEADGIAYVGWETRGRDGFQAMVERVEQAGVRVTRGDEAGRARRRVRDYAAFADPSGVPCELYYGPENDPVPFMPGRPLSGFRTGDMGLGHIVLAADDPQSSVAFYRDLLGMRLSDTIDIDSRDMHLTFLHCNGRHHSLAITNPPKGMRSGQIAHVMVEVNGLDDVGRAYDLCVERGVPMRMSIGQHTNDKMVSFYLWSPSGFAIEYGCGGRVVDDETWQVEHWNAASLWGHRLAS